MPSKHISNTILKKISKKHKRSVVNYYQPKQIHSLINKNAISGKKHGIQIGNMSQIKQEVAQPIINKMKNTATKSVKFTDPTPTKVGSRGQSSHAKPLKAAKKAVKSIEKVGKKVHIKK